MLKFEVNGKLGSYVLNLPTKLEDITQGYLQHVTKDVIVAPNYSLVALCYKEKLSTFLLAGRGTKNEVSTAVIPLFVKSGDSDSNFVNIMLTGTKLIISPSDMAMGYHVNCPKNTLNINLLAAYSEGDNQAYQRAVAIKDNIYFLEFKLVPNNAIVGCYNPIQQEGNYEHPFVITSNSGIIFK